MDTVDFVPGLELSRCFYAEAVRPVLDRHRPGLVHSAALIGPGSEVLGFDSARSADHDGGPRLLLFPRESEPTLDELLARELPREFLGCPTHFADNEGDPTRRMAPAELNQVERWFGFLTDHMLRRGVHKSVPALENDVREWIKDWNKDPKQFVWKKTAEEILDSLARYISRISGAGHQWLGPSGSWRPAPRRVAVSWSRRAIGSRSG